MSYDGPGDRPTGPRLLKDRVDQRRASGQELRHNLPPERRRIKPMALDTCADLFDTDLDTVAENVGTMRARAVESQ